MEKVMTETEIKNAAFKWSVNYKPWEQYVHYREYAQYGYEEGFKAAIKQTQAYSHDIREFDDGMFDSIPDRKEKIGMQLLFAVRLQMTYQDLAGYFKEYRHQEVKDEITNTINILETTIQSLNSQFKTA